MKCSSLYDIKDPEKFAGVWQDGDCFNDNSLFEFSYKAVFTQ